MGLFNWTRRRNIPAVLKLAEHRINNFKFIRQELRKDDRETFIHIMASCPKQGVFGAVIGENALQEIRGILIKDLEKQIRRERGKIERIRARGKA